MDRLISLQAAIDAMSAVNDSICGQQAIDALCALPSAQPEKMQLSREDATFDCISRQTAIDALDGLCDRECEYSKKQRHTMCGACHLGSAFDVIEQLPPSRENLVNNSDHIVNYLANDTNSRQAAIDMIKRYSTWSQTYSNMVEDAISRQAAIDAVMKLRNAEVEHYGKTPCKGYWELTAAREMIKMLPSAHSEPQIRCKDCRWGKEACGNIECFADANVPPEYHGYEWFCPNAERRTDG